MSDDILSKVLEGDLREAIRALTARVELLEGQEVQVDQLSQVSKDAGSVSVGGGNADADGYHTSASSIDVDWWMQLGLSDDEVSSVFASLYDGSEWAYVGGDFERIGGVKAKNLARYSLITRQWEGMGGQLNGAVNALALNGNDLIVGGEFVNADGIAAADYIAKVNVITKTWSSIGGQLNGPVYTLLLNVNDLFVGGAFVNANAISTADYIVKVDITTNTWSSIGGQLNGAVYTLLLNGNDLFVGGGYTNADGIATADRIAKVDITTNTWSSIGGQLNGPVRAFALNGNKLYVGGGFQDADGIAGADFIVEVDISTNTWSSIGGQLTAGAPSSTAVFALLYANDRLYVAGNIDSVEGDSSITGIVSFDGTEWLPVSNAGGISGLDGIVYSLCALPDGSILTGGVFDYAGSIQCKSLAVYCKPLSQAIDILASLYELYEAREPYAQNVGAVWAAPGGGLTRFFGSLIGSGIFVNGGIARVYMPKAGTINYVAIIWRANGTIGSGENISIYVRKNNDSGTDTLIATIGDTNRNKQFITTALGMDVSAGDYVEIVIVTPTWATPPTDVLLGGVVSVNM